MSISQYGAIFNDLERPLTPVSRSRYSLTLKIQIQKPYEIQIYFQLDTNRDLHTPTVSF